MGQLQLLPAELTRQATAGSFPRLKDLAVDMSGYGEGQGCDWQDFILRSEM